MPIYQPGEAQQRARYNSDYETLLRQIQQLTQKVGELQTTVHQLIGKVQQLQNSVMTR